MPAKKEASPSVVKKATNASSEKKLDQKATATAFHGGVVWGLRRAGQHLRKVGLLLPTLATGHRPAPALSVYCNYFGTWIAPPGDRFPRRRSRESTPSRN